MRVNELVEQLVNADPDSVVLYLDSRAWVDESDEILEVFVDSNVWTYETGARFGEPYDVRYPGNPRAPDDENHMLTTELVEHVVVLSNGPTNLRYVAPFKPDERQQALIGHALASHRWAQMFGRYAPSRLVRKWSSENPMPTNRAMSAQRTKLRFLGVSRLSNHGRVTVPVSVRSALRLNAGIRLYWWVTGDGFASVKVDLSGRRKRGCRDNA